MPKTKLTLVTAFALFSLFFGAGNLILPPQLGIKSGELWWLVALGFCISAVFIPILGILAHARLQGTMYHFANKVSPAFSVVYCYTIYAISITLPSPRTASVTHEIAIHPFFESPAILTSILYFALVLAVVLNRSKIVTIIGKLLTPLIILILLLMIGIGIFLFPFSFSGSSLPSPFSHGILEGYQTFDAIGAVVVGAVIIISINLKLKDTHYADKRRLISRAGWMAGLALLFIYAGLILTGALVESQFDPAISRTALLTGISKATLGNSANYMLSILVSLACFTTAVGIVTGTADFVSSRASDSPGVYTLTAIAACIIGVLMGQFNVEYIIAVALPALMFAYPITIVLILLNVVPARFAPPIVFRTVVLVTIVFSIPDFLGSLGLGESIKGIQRLIPFSALSLGWVLPALLTFAITNSFLKRNPPVAE